MKQYSLFLVLPLVLFLSSCTSNPKQDDMIPPPTSTGEVSTGTMDMETDSGMMTDSGSMTDSGVTSSGVTDSGAVQSPLVETLTGAHEEYYPIFDGTGTRVIEAIHASGVPTKVSFINSSAKSMEVKITFPDAKPSDNLRWSQVIMPDGTMDGPFGTHVGYNLTQQGGYTLIFSENSMAGDPWSGRADITITLRDTPYDMDTTLLQ